MSDQENLNDIDDDGASEGTEESPESEDPLEVSRGADTESPPPAGFLEQFEATSAASLEQLESVVMGGLTQEENDSLVSFTAKLISLAELNDSEAFAKVQKLLNK